MASATWGVKHYEQLSGATSLFSQNQFRRDGHSFRAVLIQV